RTSSSLRMLFVSPSWLIGSLVTQRSFAAADCRRLSLAGGIKKDLHTHCFVGRKGLGHAVQDISMYAAVGAARRQHSRQAPCQPHRAGFKGFPRGISYHSTHRNCKSLRGAGVYAILPVGTFEGGIEQMLEQIKQVEADYLRA